MTKKSQDFEMFYLNLRLSLFLKVFDMVEKNNVPNHARKDEIEEWFWWHYEMFWHLNKELSHVRSFFVDNFDRMDDEGNRRLD